MSSINPTPNLLVISQNPLTAEIARQAAEPGIRVDFAAGETEGLRMIGDARPDIILIGELDPPGSVARLYRRLQQGWISHHAALLVLERNLADNTHRVLGDENLDLRLGGHVLASGAESPFLPIDPLVAGLRTAFAEKMAARGNPFRRAMTDPDAFCLVWEQIPGPGAFETRQETVLENARQAAASGKVCAVSITDNPGGNPAIATDILCAEIRKSGVEPLVHVAMRDRSRNQAESLLFQLAALSIHNVLVLTGDYPSNLGFMGKSKPVFDLDSVNGLRLIAEMNRGMVREIMRKPVRLAPASFYSGVAFSPFKQMEAEVMGQYFKLQKKIRAGADFAITQVGYDARKMHEMLQWLKQQDRPLPVLAGIYVLSHPVARTMNANRIPGCVVTRKLLDEIATESAGADKGKQARLDRAAKMYALAKGMGYKGAYISGQGLPFESVEYIVARGEELAARWMDLVPGFDYAQDKGFYLFERDARTGLNTDVPARRTQPPSRPAIYRVSQAVHSAVFEQTGPLFRPVRKLMARIDRSPFWKGALHRVERCGKNSLYTCKDCGDCALFDAAYLCPVSQCPKDQRNAPCGGSYEGWCEVYPGEIECIWVRAYRRLKSEGREQEIAAAIVPPCDWELWHTSSWINYFLGRDHSSRRKGILPPAAKTP